MGRDNEVLHRGFQSLPWADQGLVSAANADVADAITKYSLGGGQYGEAFGDGDMVIHIDALNPGVTSGNSSDQNIANTSKAIDFELNIDSVTLQQEAYARAAKPGGGLMFSDIDMA